MPVTKPRHAYTYGELYRELRGTSCGLRDSNLRVHVRASGNAFYADALVVCGEAEIVHEARAGDSLLDPAVIIEVLSPSTEEYDRGQKFDDYYRFIPSLREHVIVAQEHAAIEIRSRDEAGTCPPGCSTPETGHAHPPSVASSTWTSTVRRGRI